MKRKRNLKQSIDMVRKMFLLQQALKFGTIRILKHKENYLIILIFLACDVSIFLFYLEWKGKCTVNNN